MQPLRRPTGGPRGRTWSGVGAGPWPSEDLDLDFIIQLLHDPLLFDGQDCVADWTTAVKGKHFQKQTPAPHLPYWFCRIELSFFIDSLTHYYAKKRNNAAWVNSMTLAVYIQETVFSKLRVQYFESKYFSV